MSKHHMSDNRHTLEFLKELQALPFERKILITQTRIMEWYHRNGGKVYVSYSAGKDSAVLLHMVRQQFPDVPAVFVNTTLEYPENIQLAKAAPNCIFLKPKMNFRQVLEKYGYPVIGKDVARTIYYARRGGRWANLRLKGLRNDGEGSSFRQRYKRWAHLVDAPFLIGDGCCEVMKEQPCMTFEKETGLSPFIGTLASESRRRTEGWLKAGCNAFDSKRPRSAPLSFWTEQDILRYIDTYGVPLSKVYGEIVKTDKGYKTTGAERTGCYACLFGCHLDKKPNRIQRLATTHPKLHAYCMKDYADGGLGLRQIMEYLDIPHQEEN